MAEISPPRGDLTARPTVYKGVHMRSRTEARFAAGLDELGLAWTYEPECFADETGQYLPDFRVEGLGYVEVRGSCPDVRPVLDQMRVIRSSDQYAQLLVAIPDQPFLWGDWMDVYTVPKAHEFLGNVVVHTGPFDVVVGVCVPFGVFREHEFTHFDPLCSQVAPWVYEPTAPTDFIPFPWGSYR